jgi:hypothetical protein
MFTLGEAQALLPHVESLLRKAVSAKSEASDLEEYLQGVMARITVAGGMEIDPAAIAEKKVLRDRAVRQAQGAVIEIQEVGCVVKDLDTGLLDFPARLDGEEIYLCWKLGEERIGYWHRVEEGFAGRKPIGTEFGEQGGSTRPN